MTKINNKRIIELWLGYLFVLRSNFTWLRAIAAAIFSIALSSCATAPIEETRAFDKAVAAIKSAGDTLLDTVAAAEKRTHVARLKRKKGAYAFSVADAPYIATIGEPPNIAAYRQSLQILKTYSGLLLALASGEGLDKAQADLISIAKSLSSLAKMTSFVPAVEALSPIIDQALRAHSTAEARRIARNGIPAVRELIAAFRESAGAMFDIILADRSLSGAGAKSIEADRILVANTVVLFDSLDVTLAQLEIAYDRQSAPGTLAGLVDAAAKLNADVDSVRKTYAILRQ